MAPLEELISREYFERNGFYFKRLTLTVENSTKYKAPQLPLPAYLLQRQTGRSKNQELADRFQLFSSDIGGLALATMIIVPWLGTGLTQPIFQNPTRYRSWIRNTIVPTLIPIQNSLNELTTPDVPLSTLLLPGIPAHDPHRKEVIQYLKKSGIEAVFTLRTFMESLIQQVDIHSQTPDSALSELLRLLSIYGLISPPQLDLFNEF